MKKIFLPFVAAITLTACSKDDQLPGDYQTPLPEATQTGKGTFACYVDGMAYIAQKNQITAYYQFTQGHYAFVITGTKKNKPLYTLFIGSSSSTLIEGTTYDLKKRENGNQWGGYHLYMNLKFHIRSIIWMVLLIKANLPLPS